MKKSRILIIDCGGTICQEPNEDNILYPSDKEYLINSNLRQMLDTHFDITLVMIERIDSSAMLLSHRIQMALCIQKNFDDYDGFVIIQGTDTLAESAAALTYMIQTPGKPIVLTGSQISIFDHTKISDAYNNIFYACQCASEDFGEVMIYFGNHAFRGVRSYKRNMFTFDAFSSIDSMPLAEVGVFLHKNSHRVRRDKTARPSFFLDASPYIICISPISGACDSAILSSIITNAHVEGIIITSYGTGNLPQYYVPYIEDAIALHKPVCIISNCSEEIAISSTYATGQQLIKAGALPLLGITQEAVGQKMMYALGRTQSEQISTQLFITRVYTIMQEIINHDIHQ